MSTPRTIYRCADCLLVVGAEPRRWPISDTHWQPACEHCWRARLEIDIGLHVAIASTICKEHAYLLDNPHVTIIHERPGGAE
jgi:hypothetical protein